MQWDMEVAVHDDGANVAMVDKREQPGGNTSLSTGSIPGDGSRFQRTVQIQDFPETMVVDLKRIAGEHDLSQLCEWLVDRVQARMSLITDYCHVGHSIAPRAFRWSSLR